VFYEGDRIRGAASCDAKFKMITDFVKA